MASWITHIVVHIEEDTLTFQQCDNELETMRALQLHIEEEHRLNKTVPLTLTEINRIFNGSINLGEIELVLKLFPCKQYFTNLNILRALKDHSWFHQKVYYSNIALKYHNF